MTSVTRPGDVLRLPINHFEGNFTCSPETMAELLEHDQIVFRYRDNPNGSMDDIAGVCNRARNVVGLMPHPERASTSCSARPTARAIFAGLLAAAATSRPARWLHRAVSPAFLSTAASTPISRHAA